MAKSAIFPFIKGHILRTVKPNILIRMSLKKSVLEPVISLHSYNPMNTMINYSRLFTQSGHHDKYQGLCFLDFVLFFIFFKQK